MNNQTKLVIIAVIIFFVSISISLFIFVNDAQENEQFFKSDLLNKTFDQTGRDSMILVSPSEDWE